MAASVIIRLEFNVAVLGAQGYPCRSACTAFVTLNGDVEVFCVEGGGRFWHDAVANSQAAIMNVVMTESRLIKRWTKSYMGSIHVQANHPNVFNSFTPCNNPVRPPRRKMNRSSTGPSMDSTPKLKPWQREQDEIRLSQSPKLTPWQKLRDENRLPQSRNINLPPGPKPWDKIRSEQQPEYFSQKARAQREKRFGTPKRKLTPEEVSELNMELDEYMSERRASADAL